MLRLPGIELIELEHRLARSDLYILQGCRNRDCTAHAAIGAVAAPDGLEPVTQPNLKSYSAAMAGAL